MATVRPFSALRPPSALVERVASPPYDVISTAEARELASGNLDSFLYVSRPEIALAEGTDEHASEVYAEGKRQLLHFVERGALLRDAEPHLYVYAQRMGEHRQVGVVCCVSVAEYVADTIKKHEKTRPDKEDDRTRHIDTLDAHDEPVFLSYRANALVDAAVARAMAAPPEYDFATEDAVHHRLWVVPADESRAISALFAREVDVMYVADGHHRSAAAARVHAARRGDGGEHDVFLAVIFPHDQMNILPYNRVVTDRQGRDPTQLLAALRERFDVEPTDYAAPKERGSFGVFLGESWYRARPRQVLGSDPVSLLDCHICQEQILAPIFGIDDPRRDASIDFVGGIRGQAELERRVRDGKASIAIYLYPTSMADVMAVSDAGLIMPPKSTWFEPKLKSGLFVHTF
ncbi:MAG: DUF1015 domain-containing protein [Myxococcales bacterium]|nr:DUF1015 domain-containing protein [Myxococcales bacterium]